MLGFGQCERGQDVMEYALVLPLLMLLVLGILEFGIVIFTYDSIANAAREGARYGIIHHDPSDYADIELAARRSTIGLDPTALQFTIGPSGDDAIQVEVDYDHNLITAPIIQAVGGDPTVHLHTVATMQIE